MAEANPESHPCVRCGACCAFFRVSFYWREADSEENPAATPSELTEDFNPFLRVMRGTNNKHHTRCVALEGKVGESVACGIYSRRPSPCSAFEASFENGEHNDRCDKARARYQLPPLKASDWAVPREPSLSVT